MEAKRLKILAGAVAFALALSSPALAADDAQTLIDRGAVHVKTKDYEKALREFEAAVKIDPKHPKARLMLGLTQASLGRFDVAIKETEKAIELDPSYAAFHNLGLIQANRGKYKESIEAYKKALEKSPRAYRTWYQLGLVYATTADYVEAVNAYNKALEAFPNLPEAVLGIGSALYWSGDVKGAMEQAGKLRKMGFGDHARALEGWIRQKEEGKGPAKA